MMQEGPAKLALQSVSFFGPELKPYEQENYEINIEIVQTDQGLKTALATYLPLQRRDVVAWYTDPMVVELGEIPLPPKTWVDIRF